MSRTIVNQYGSTLIQVSSNCNDNNDVILNDVIINNEPLDDDWVIIWAKQELQEDIEIDSGVSYAQEVGQKQMNGNVDMNQGDVKEEIDIKEETLDFISKSNCEARRCYFCDKVFSYNSNLLCHLMTHIGEKNFDKVISLNSSLIGHLRTHEGELPYQCTQCDLFLSQNTQPINTQTLEDIEVDINDDFYSHNTPVNMVYLYQPVQQAAYSYRSDHPILEKINNNEDHSRYILANMDLHQTVKQKTTDSYQCSHCDNYFSQNYDSIIQQQIHTREKPYQCSLFEKCLARKNEMLNHSRTTNEENPYQCKLCDKCVVQKLVINQSYKCCYCGKCFLTVIENNAHQKIHIVKKEELDSYCRVCGIAGEHKRPLRPKLRRLLAWMYQLLDFDAERAETQVLCIRCDLVHLTVLRDHKKHFHYRNSQVKYRYPKSRSSVVVWDSDGRCPVYQRDGVPYRYSFGPKLLPDGSIRSSNEVLADHKVEYPIMVDNTARDKFTPKVTPCNLCKNNM